ncbi:MAG TPA: type 1 glutamine amidotransferase [Acidimicrobiales bacterium]|nr:type 1 glutamine amidotransferase [Acidimicrobiales bacterium]
MSFETDPGVTIGSAAWPGDRHRPWAVVQHVSHEGPGLIGEALRQAGLTFEVVRADLGDGFPSVAELGGLVVMGGPMGVHDVADHPWLLAERELLAEAVEGGLPVLGVCLGAQQLALALGAEVTTGAAAEIGMGSVELTGPGRLDPVLGPEYGGLAPTAIACVHWHQDTFALPSGAVHLAATPRYPNQAFRVGDKVYGLQFHVEVDRTLAQSWAPLIPGGTPLDEGRLVEAETVGRRILRRFVSVAIGSIDGAEVPK